MSRHIDLGKKGEDWAIDWLTRKGYEILHRNWRQGRYEIDIIARRQNVYHFIEVKCRKTRRYGPPETGVNPQKLRNMMQAAAGWLTQLKSKPRIQYDVLSITSGPAGPDYRLFEDVYV